MGSQSTLSVAGYYGGAASRALWAAIEWTLGQGIALTLLVTAGTILFEFLVVAMRWRAGANLNGWLLYTLETVRALVGGCFIAAFLLFAWFFVQDAPKQIADRDQRIAELGGAPDAPIHVPATAKNNNQVADAINTLSSIVNKDMVSLCDEAKKDFICSNDVRNKSVSECFDKAGKTLIHARLIADVLWTNADAGLMVKGDSDTVSIMKQAIQMKDRQVFVELDDAALATREKMFFLTLLTAEERSRLFDAALNLSEGPSKLQSATNRYCALIDKTNGRIAEIRKQMSP
jgi:hypothetical protein